MVANDKTYLKDFASKIRSKIEEQQPPPPFRIAPKVDIREVGSGGWAAKVGVFRGYTCSVEIWFDTFTSYDSRKLYYGLYSSKSDGITKIANLSKEPLGEYISISRSDWADDDENIHLKKRLGIREFGRPIFEQYPKSEYLYGIYEYEKFGLQRNETKRLVSRIAEFIGTINDALVSEKLKQDTKDYEAEENRKAVQRHLRRERDGYLVTLAKHRDNFVCQICGFDYRETYGDLGDDFAEAHHIVPLGKNDKKRTTKVDDLITVCANCHRMLHRMNGTANDISRLRRIINKNQ